MKYQHLLIILVIILGVVVIIPPLQPAPFTISNTNWDGTSKFKELIEQKMNVSESTIPLRLLGDNVQKDVVIVVGGNLPYFSEDGNYLYQYVKNGGNLILFEDHGYARLLTSAFGITLGGTVIDQTVHDSNPYKPLITQSSFSISGYDIPSPQVVFNHAVRVQFSRLLRNSSQYPLFETHGNVWEDSNRDGNFYRNDEHVPDNESCFLGAILDFEEGGKFIVIGDSAFPTNDMIDQKENYRMLSVIIDLLASSGAKSVIFDESRKIWIPPTGKAAIGTITVLLMGLFHSPLIAISTLIIIGGIIGIRNDEKIIQPLRTLRKFFQSHDEIKPIPAFIQSEEEEEFARLAKSNVISDLYRSLLADEIRSNPSQITFQDKVELENMLKQRYIDFRDYNRLIRKLSKDNTERN
ncbi:MAG: DUF4350 domain-containing protein [Candidatus Hodarchaeales archaeon]